MAKTLELFPLKDFRKNVVMRTYQFVVTRETDFGEEAWVGNDADVTLAAYKAYVKKQQERGLISAEAAQNRTLLLEIMDAVGLRPYVKEWWHYQEKISMPATRERYKLLEF